MKYSAIISSLFILFTGFLLIRSVDSWNPKNELPKQKILKSVPVKPTQPVNEQPEKNKKDSVLPIQLDSIKTIPVDSIISAPSMDTIRATQRLERKPDIRFYRRIRQYNFHRSSPIS